MKRLAILTAVLLLIGASSAQADKTHAYIERDRGHYYVFFNIKHECRHITEALELGGVCPWFDEMDVYAGRRSCPVESTARARIYIGRVWTYAMDDEEGERIPRMNTHHITVCLYVDEVAENENVGEYHFRLAHKPR
jgi:hypothetical protein